MSVTDTIDKAISDWETSPDAMRWTPDPKQASPRPAAPARSAVVHIHIDMAGFARSMAAAARTLEGLGAALRLAARQPKRPARRPAHISRMHAAYRAKGRKR